MAEVVAAFLEGQHTIAFWLLLLLCCHIMVESHSEVYTSRWVQAVTCLVNGCSHVSSGMHFAAASAQFTCIQIKPCGATEDAVKTNSDNNKNQIEELVILLFSKLGWRKMIPWNQCVRWHASLTTVERERGTLNHKGPTSKALMSKETGCRPFFPLWMNHHTEAACCKLSAGKAQPGCSMTHQVAE